MRWSLLLTLALAACSKGLLADLPSISEARSLGAEWAMVNEQQARGNLTPTYATTMRRQLREQLQSDLSSLSQPHSDYGQEIRALVAMSDDAQPNQLRARARALKQVEDRLESN